MQLPHNQRTRLPNTVSRRSPALARRSPGTRKALERRSPLLSIDSQPLTITTLHNSFIRPPFNNRRPRQHSEDPDSNAHEPAAAALPPLRRRRRPVDVRGRNEQEEVEDFEEAAAGAGGFHEYGGGGGECVCGEGQQSNPTFCYSACR